MRVTDIDNVRKDDQLTKQHLGDTRKPKLMLSHLNKLRKVRELDNLERIVQSEQLGIIFGDNSSENDMM